MKKPGSKSKIAHLVKHIRYLKNLKNNSYSVSTNRKKQRIRGNIEDSISGLPKDILVHILSFLPMKAILRISTVSKRWYNICSSFHNLEFVIRESPEEFVKMVGHFLRQHDGSQIHRFHLRFHTSDDYLSEIKKWVKFVIRRLVKELILDFSEGDFKGLFKLPSRIFHCGSIRTLNLNFCDFNPSSFRGLTSLQSLSLINTVVTSALIQRLVFHCPVLESLELSECLGIRYLKVLAPGLQLKYLIVRHCSYLRGIVVSAPKLLMFQYHGRFGRFAFNNISCLVDLTLDIPGFPLMFHSIEADLSRVEILTVPSSLFMCLHRKLQGDTSGSLPIPLHNLKELHLLIQTPANGELLKLAQYLEIYPDLHEISIKLATLQYWNHTEINSEQTTTRTSDGKFNHIRTIKIKEFRGKNDEMWMIKYFLEKATVLESLILIGHRSRDISLWDLEPRFTLELLEELRYLPRTSSNAKIVLYSDENNCLIC